MYLSGIPEPQLCGRDKENHGGMGLLRYLAVLPSRKTLSVRQTVTLTQTILNGAVLGGTESHCRMSAHRLIGGTK